MPHRLKEAIINSASEVAGIAGSRVSATMNMVADYGVLPTASEASTLVRAAEEYLRTVRGVMQGWVARIPAEEAATQGQGRRKEDQDLREEDIRTVLDAIAPADVPVDHPETKG